MPHQSSPLPTKPQRGQFGGVIYTTASFQILKKIGQGASGIVYWVIDKATGQHLVIKKVPKIRATKQEIEKEVKILEALQPYCHKYILCYTDYFEDTTSYYLVTEHLDGYIPLNQLPAGIDNQRLIDIICNLVRGLLEIHQLNIAHRDIKPDNILVNTNETGTSIKYIDFGVACQGDECSTETVSGTPSYIAPELITDVNFKHNFANLEKTDYWSLGMVIYFLITKKAPFEIFFPLLKIQYEDQIKDLDQRQQVDFIMEKYAETYSFPSQKEPLIQIDRDVLAFNEGLKKDTQKELGFEVSLTNLL